MTKTVKDNQRVDKWIAAKYPELNNRQIDEAIEQRLVVGPKRSALKKGDKIITIPDCSALEKHLEELWNGNKKVSGIKILYKEDGFIVIDKPAGLPSHPIGLFDDKTVTSWALASFSGLKDEFKEKVQPTLCPHRLDTDTSGLLIVCLSQDAFNEWRKVFNEKKVTKTYLAWCWGKPRQETWTIDKPIAHDKKDKTRMVVVEKEQTPHRAPLLPAKTSFKVIKRLKDRFLVEAVMQTGVTHQVRVHLAYSGYPLVGDRQYDQRYTERARNAKHHLLRAQRIQVDTGKKAQLTFKAEMEDFSRLFD